MTEWTCITKQKALPSIIKFSVIIIASGDDFHPMLANNTTTTYETEPDLY